MIFNPQRSTAKTTPHPSIVDGLSRTVRPIGGRPTEVPSGILRDVALIMQPYFYYTSLESSKADLSFQAVLNAQTTYIM